MNDAANSPARLHPQRLAALPADVQQPSYDRSRLASGIVHLGIGAFARAHLAVAVERALAQHPDDRRWGIVGVSMRQPDTHDALAPQQGLYTLAVRDAERDGAPRQRLQVIGCLRELLVAPREPQAVVDRIAAPETAIVSVTITEKGYAASGAGSAVDFIVRGLAQRRAQGHGGLTLLSLDNLPGNGRQLHDRVLARAVNEERALTDWIDARCSFPCSMVDRIVPRTTPADVHAVSAALGLHDAWPVVAEPFTDWALEDRFAAGRPAFDAALVRIVDAAAPWERVKLRLVNGAHSQIAYLGAMARWPTVDAALARPELAAHVEALLRDEVEPTLGTLAGWDRAAYRAALLQRWRNPALAHRCQQIAMDGSQKIPQRWIAPLAERLAAGQGVARMAFGLAAWLHYLRGRDESGASYPIDDPQAAALQALPLEAEPEAAARALLAFAPVCGPLAAAPAAQAAGLAATVAAHLRALRERGVVGALRSLGP
ncbi:MAG: mannitol dehydrogenase family protein [Burkholderiaceae bacterium]